MTKTIYIHVKKYKGRYVGREFFYLYVETFKKKNTPLSLKVPLFGPFFLGRSKNV